jgi:hypothetical protein
MESDLNSDPIAGQTSATAKMTSLARRRSCGRCGSFQNFVFKGHAFGIVFLEPGFRGILIGENLEVIAVSDLLACIH